MTFGIVKMLIGVPKEIKDSEYRVGLVPSTVRELTRNGHRVLVEKSADWEPALPTPITIRSEPRSCPTRIRSMRAAS